ncbi:MAG: hypothetical protein M3028_05835 [Bifidobacterium sp.]|nr:hypothetical protein [Bifidobacterium sp.]
MLDIRHSFAFHPDAIAVGNRLLMAVRQLLCWIFVDDTVSALGMSNAALTCSKWILFEVVVGRNLSTTALFHRICESWPQQIIGAFVFMAELL